MGNWSAEFKHGFFVGAGVLAAVVVVGLVAKAL